MISALQFDNLAMSDGTGPPPPPPDNPPKEPPPKPPSEGISR